MARQRIYSVSARIPTTSKWDREIRLVELI
jgi:hypothetical protein